MTTWSGPICTDCGKEMEKPGTCNDCILAHQEAGRKIREDLAKIKDKGK
jgi:hypothetical protein